MAKSASVLVVEDDPNIVKMLQHYLSKRAYDVRAAKSSEEALKLIHAGAPDIILLDWMLPGASGYQLLRYLRQESGLKEIPILMLTARDEEDNKVKALLGGADDYLTKPFSLPELGARMHRMLQRIQPQKPEEDLKWEDINLQPNQRQVTVRQESIHMGPVDFDLLHFFMTHPYQVHSRAQLLRSVWGAHRYVEERTVDVQIGRLRRLLKPYDYHRLIETVYGMGYRLRKHSDC